MKVSNILASTAAVLLVASSAWAAPGKPESKVEQSKLLDQKAKPLTPLASTARRRPLPPLLEAKKSTNVVPSGKVNEVEGTLTGFDDGTVLLDEALSSEYIALIAKTKQVPVSSVPKFLRRRYRIDAGMSRLRLERRVGDRVRLKLGRDANAVAYVIDVSDVKK